MGFTLDSNSSGETLLASLADINSQTATISREQASAVMLSRIPTILLGLYIVNGVLANYSSEPKSDVPSTTGPSPPQSQESRAKEKAVREGLKFTEHGLFAPRPFHFKRPKLIKKMRKHWDPFWMSIDEPQDFNITYTNSTKDQSDIAQDWTDTINTSNLIRYLNYAGKNGSASDFGEGNEESSEDAINDVVGAVRRWMIEKATCPVRYVWEDLGLLFWPRYIRRGFCSFNSLSASLKTRIKSSSPLPTDGHCSWPSGMFCRNGEEKRLRILVWTCRSTQRSKQSRRHRGKGKSKTSGMTKTRGSFQQTLVSVGSARRFAAAGEPPKNNNPQTPEDNPFKTKSAVTDAQSVLLGGRDFSKMMSEIQSNRQKRSASKDDMSGNLAAIIAAQSFPHEFGKFGAVTTPKAKQDWSHLSWKDVQKKFKKKCFWKRVKIPRVDTCLCACY
ncbi:noggin-like [Plakobranchus ocellatus]|uniref:Noggin-like n=1 Tax=Plakobranchus ocellatus TaxID=259542 RepID=A0AAV4D4Q0_9GAST|nr:noggin-like [Plakobranchus ocellatus]